MQSSSDEVSLILEGRLLSPWVEELELAVTAVRSAAPVVRLELSALRFVDEQGLALFLQLQDQGIQLCNASPFVHELLKTGRG